MKYNCDICKYETDNKSNYNRHIKSIAHISQASKKQKVVKTNKKKKVYVCDCKKEFYYESVLVKHKKTCIPETIDIDNEVYELKGHVKILINVVNSLKEEIHTNKPSNITNYNISVKNYAQLNYPDAPVLKPPTDYAKLTYENKDLIDTVLYHYAHKSLYKHFGDFIIGYYKKDNPSDQSLWTSDVSRLTYIIKESLAGKESIWNHDPKGNKTKKYIIKPILDYIVKAMDEYWEKELKKNICKHKGDIDVDALEKRQKKFNISKAIEADINNGVLADDIIKYISPILHMDIPNSDKINNKQIKEI